MWRQRSATCTGTADNPDTACTAPGPHPDSERAIGHATASRLAVSIGLSVASDAVEKVPTGGELTLIEAVGRAGPDFLVFCRSSPVGDARGCPDRRGTWRRRSCE